MKRNAVILLSMVGLLGMFSIIEHKEPLVVIKIINKNGIVLDSMVVDDGNLASKLHVISLNQMSNSYLQLEYFNE